MTLLIPVMLPFVRKLVRDHTRLGLTDPSQQNLAVPDQPLIGQVSTDLSVLENSEICLN